MTWKNVLGVLLLIAIFGGLFGATVWSSGIKTALMAWGISIGVVIIGVFAGVLLSD